MPKFNLGYKVDEATSIPSGSNKGDKTYYESIQISTKNVKGLELKVGEEVKLIGVVVGRDEHKRNDEEKDVRYTIEIKQLNKGMSEKEYENLSDDEKDEIDEKDMKEE